MLIYSLVSASQSIGLLVSYNLLLTKFCDEIFTFCVQPNPLAKYTKSNFQIWKFGDAESSYTKFSDEMWAKTIYEMQLKLLHFSGEKKREELTKKKINQHKMFAPFQLC